MRLFLNDQLVDAAAARIDPSDAGLLHGIGLFETLRVYRGVPFMLDAHLDRLTRSAETLGLAVGRPREQVAAAARAVVEANGLSDARMRITVTRGPTEDGGPTLLVTATGEVGYPANFYADGIAVGIAATRVNPTDPMAGHKSLNYWPRLQTLAAARANQFAEAVWFTPDGRAASGCISNLFAVRDGRLLTPPLDTPVLPGVARALVLELARGDGIEAAEQPIFHDELNAADEVFLTNSIMEVMPVVLIERRAVGDGKVGPMARALAELYRRRVEKETAP